MNNTVGKNPCQIIESLDGWCLGVCMYLAPRHLGQNPSHDSHFKPSANPAANSQLLLFNRSTMIQRTLRQTIPTAREQYAIAIPPCTRMYT